MSLGMEKKQDFRLVALAVGLWLLTVVLTFYAIVNLLEVLMRVYAAFWADGGFYSPATQAAIGLRQFLLLPLGFLGVAITIGGAEYHREHFNTRQSWRLFARTLGVQLGLLLLGVFI
ncbi:MAG: hypothetical protein BWY25_01462 [Chloroflexi bacterium ADurb.Bin222]|nr:MAG: hypothetical protein BWY25_01462 [Chloroflexi bacterium ADurb.Bin222]